MNPTRRQLQIVNFVKLKIKEQGFAPSIQEICDRFHLSSTATVHKHLKNIEARGLIVRSRGRARAMQVRGSIRLVVDAVRGSLIDTATGDVIQE